MDGRPDRRNNAAFSYFTGVVRLVYFTGSRLQVAG